MINRHLTLISNPGNSGDKNYVKTTEETLNRWEIFFKSPMGGYWQDSEITRYDESKPVTPDEVKKLMIPLNTYRPIYTNER